MHRLFATLSIVGLALSGCAKIEHERNFRVDPRAAYVRAELADIVATAHEYREADVVFTAVFNSSSEVIYVPAYTPFTEEKHVAFSVWVEGTRFWNASDNIQGMVRTLYMRKDNPSMGRLVRIRQFQPVRIKGIVRSNFNDIPWIEAFDITPVGAPVCSTAGLRAMLMGMDAAKADDIEGASSLFRQAGYEIDSPNARTDINLSLARALVKRRTLPDVERAIGHYRTALSSSGGDTMVRLELDRAQMMADMLRRGEPLERIPELPEAPGAARPPRDTSSAELLRTLQGMLAKKDEEIAELKRLMTQAGGATSEALSRSEAERESLGRQIAELRNEAVDAANRLDEARNQMADLETKIERFQAEMNKAVEEREEIQAQLDAAIEARAKGQERESMLEQQIAEANERIAGLERAMAEGGDEQKNRIVELERQKGALESDIARLKAAAAAGTALKSKVADLEARLEDLEGEKSDLMAELEKARAGAGGDETLKAKVAELDAKVQALEASKAELAQELKRAKAAGGVDEKALRKEIAKEYEEEILDYQKLVNRQRETIKQLEARIKELENK
jgi:predicted  nucleic acid-binding Zn-ribbon protein